MKTLLSLLLCLALASCQDNSTYKELKKDTVKIKMELAEIQTKKGVYELYWQAEKTSSQPIKTIKILSSNSVELLNLCRDCEWKDNKANGKNYILSIDVWKKMDKIELD